MTSSQTPKIALTCGKVALVDIEDAPELLKFQWYALQGASGIWYAMMHKYDSAYKLMPVYMHRLILNAPIGIIVDHRNRNGLDNRRANLRLASGSENQWNAKKPRHGILSKYKGVTWSKSHRKWVVRIAISGKRKHLGYFNNEEDAANAYDQAARKFFGEFARVNIPFPGEQGI